MAKSSLYENVEDTEDTMEIMINRLNEVAENDNEISELA